MKDKHNKSISLKCTTCGDTSFEFNEDKSWVKCKRCEREYHGGYEELVKLNQDEINEQLNEIKKEVTQELGKELNTKLKEAFRGNKNIKLK